MRILCRMEYMCSKMYDKLFIEHTTAGRIYLNEMIFSAIIRSEYALQVERMPFSRSLLAAIKY